MHMALIGALGGEEMTPNRHPPGTERRKGEFQSLRKYQQLKEKGEEPSGLVRLKACAPSSAGKYASALTVPGPQLPSSPGREWVTVSWRWRGCGQPWCVSESPSSLPWPVASLLPDQCDFRPGMT